MNKLLKKRQKTADLRLFKFGNSSILVNNINESKILKVVTFYKKLINFGGKNMNIFKKVWCRVFQKCFRLALPLLPYREPEILEELNKISDLLKCKDINSVLLVTDKKIRELGLTKHLEESIVESKIYLSVYDEVVPNPTISNIEEALKLYKKDNCKAIIAFGGGSVIDCAKIVGARSVKPKQSVQKMKGLLRVGKKLPTLIAVPTTAGTGSEVTLAAVITDCKTHYKYPINDFNLIPHYAVLDPSVTVGLPKGITSTTGLDALTHAVEAYIGGSTTKLTRKMSEEAVSLIDRYLLRAYRDGSDMEARAGMLRAAYSAGVAFTRSYVGYVHAVAHSLGGKYGVPHGLANAIILPYFLDEYNGKITKKLAKLARNSGVCDKALADNDAAETFKDWVKNLNKEMNIPNKIEQLREEDIEDLSRRADAEANPLYPVPVLMNAKELAKMYKRLIK